MVPTFGPYEQTQRGGDVTGAARESAWPTNEFGFAPQAACAPCNNVWMDGIDRAAEAVVEPMVVGQAKTLSYGDQRTIAQWVTQVAAIIDQTQTQQVIPQEIRERFYKDREPLAGLTIWLARASLDDDIFSVEAWNRAWVVSRGAEPPPPNKPNLCLVTFRVIQLVVQALIPLDGMTWAISRGTNMKYLRQTWPSDLTPVSWPPEGSLARTDVDAFSRSFEPPDAKLGDSWTREFPGDSWEQEGRP